MPDPKTMQRITGYVVGASALLVLTALMVGGVEMAIAAVVGGVFSVANWVALRWVGGRLVVANDKGRAVWGTLLAAKMALSMFLVWAILATGVVDPIGFAIGLSGLVLGILVGTFHSALSASAPIVEET
ncbi:MAG TPA: hypothetical protein ENK57_25730 [Polyangiaceae bacterium]|nr:hypothetical protein [Polyangiaceae bacterium]